MNIKLSVCAVLALSGQLAFAEAPAAPVASEPAAASTAPEQAGGQVQVAPAEKSASASQIKSLEHDVSPSLQSKLDQMMSFGSVPPAPSRQEIASVN